MEKKVIPFKGKLTNIQHTLKAPKNLYNNFGKYSYRNAEGIFEAVKPLLAEYGLVLTVTDEPVIIGDRYYIKATATLFDMDSDETMSVSAYAREEQDKKGMDASQVTGSCSSYARKYALNGLFLLDDTKDADTDEFVTQTKQTPAPAAQPNIANMKISSKQVGLVKGKLKEKNIPESAVLQKYKVTKLEELNATDVTNVLHDIEVTKAKPNPALEALKDDGEPLPWH